tara:strand:+ start:895 stop:1077 length:183 start_codon:yes stop_codon:yes gene_type:complete
MPKTKDKHPPRMMTSKDDYEHDSVDAYINELLLTCTSIQDGHIVIEKPNGMKTILFGERE